MAKKELAKIDVYQGDELNSTIYVLSLNINGLTTYERAKAIARFIDKETRVLEMAIDNDLRQVIRALGVSIADGSDDAMAQALADLRAKGIEIALIDRYYELNNEKIIGESPNHMTVIEEDGVISSAMEVIVNENIR